MTRPFFIVVLTICITAHAGNLVENGKSRYTIVIPSNPSATQQTAANELQDYLKEVSGAELPIKRRGEMKDQAGPVIAIGDAIEPLGPDEIYLKSDGENLLIGGTEPRGIIYAAETFLEDYVGVRWWTSSETFVPTKPTIELPKIDIAYTPKLRYREAYYFDAMGDHSEFAMRCKLNGRHNNIPRELGGAYRIIGWMHTFYNMLPPDKYFAQHPEWYSEIKGTRTTASAQLCLSNDEMRKEMTRVALEQIAQDPEAGIISISQNDCLNPCQCAKCAAIVKEEGSESGPLIHFVNGIAEEVAKKYPDFLVETLAYQYTRHPPLKVHPHKNVLVRLCSIEADFSHALDAPSNKAFYDDLRGWSAISNNLFIWNYVTDFGNLLLPHPNMTTLGSDLKLFTDNHVIGVFEQGDAENRAGDFLQLRVWLLAHLMWDPTRDQAKLTEEFLNGYYGPAAPHLAKYLELVNAPSKDPAYRKGCISGDASYWTAENADKAAKIFDAALAAVGDEKTFRPRVERERLAVRHLQIIRGAPTKTEAEAFAKDAEAAGIQNLAEGALFKPYVQGIIDRAK